MRCSDHAESHGPPRGARHGASPGAAADGSELVPSKAGLAQDRVLSMTWVPGGSFRMGSADFYPEEHPVHRVTVDGFWMDSGPVTVAEFRRFVTATGYVTVAERTPDPADYPE